MEWTAEQRVAVARNVAIVLREESRNVIMSWRVHELSELILFALTMPASVLRANPKKYAEFLDEVPNA